MQRKPDDHQLNIVKVVVYPLISTTFFYLGFSTILHKSLEPLISSFFSIDFLLQLIAGVVLFSMSKKETVFLLVQSVMMGILYLASPIKMAFFSSDPFSPYDMPALLALIEVLPLGNKIIIVSSIFLIALLFVTNLKMNTQSGIALLASVFVGSSMFYLHATDIDGWLNRRYSPQIWNKKYDYYVEGGTLYFVHELARMVTKQESLPDRGVVDSSLSDLRKLSLMVADDNKKNRRVAYTSANKRNVYVVVVESLTDPVATLGIPESNDPYFLPFRSLYQKGGSSTSLSPVYTGGTANAEFEILCGLPVFEGIVAFEYEIKNSNIGCLPERLKEHGYSTLAVHPNVKSIWNRDYAYPKLGFESYYYKSNFELHDMNGSYLSDQSLFRQNLTFLKNQRNPSFNYVLTIAAHYPYQLGKNRSVYRHFANDELLDAYMNLIHYTTKEIYSYIVTLQGLDADAVIVIVGDHSPYFGPNLRGYISHHGSKDSGLAMGAGELLALTSTPLLIIDGKNGPISVGRLSHYEIPGVIYSLLGIDAPAVTQYILHNHNMHIRPIPGYPLVAWSANGVYVCGDDATSPACQSAFIWRSNVEILRRDLLYGAQYQLQRSKPGSRDELTR